MQMIRKLFYLFLIFVSACIDPLQVDVPSADTRLVVDGMITNEPGPHKVKLFSTNKLNTTRLEPFKPVTGATVSIADDLGQEYFLYEAYPGTYQTNENDLTGEIGRSYHVIIKTAADREYRSAPQLLKEPGELTNVYFEFATAALPGYSGSFDDALRIFVDAKGISGSDNLYRWRWKTIHKVRSYPELQTRSTPGGEIPEPEPCSGYIRGPGRTVIQVGDCTCCFCWSYSYSEGAHVSKNEYVNANLFNKQNLGLIPVTSMHFFDKYYLEVQQLSLSEEAYDFWNLVEKQQKGTSDLFQPDAIKIRGNIRNVANDNEEVLGFFGVSGTASKSMYIDPAEVPYPFGEIDIVRYSCIAYFKNSTNQMPSFW
jgi:hypothetical protein